MTISTKIVSSEPVAPVVEIGQGLIKDPRQAWKDMVKRTARDSAPLAQMLREAVIHTTEAGVVVVHVRYKFHVEKLSEKKNRAKVEEMLEELTQVKWRVEYQQTDSLPRRTAVAALSNGTHEAAAAIFGGHS